jgi:hypothetical protein
VRRFLFALGLLFAMSAVLQAQDRDPTRSGCCSQHGGVCGCQCCDGTPLSQTCLPYYPWCGDTIPAPSGLGGSATSSSSCVLTWVDNSFGETGFQIEEMRSNQTSFTLIDAVGANTTSATIDQLQPSTTYSFRVRAKNGSASSSYSNVTSLTTLPDPATLCKAPLVCFTQGRFSVAATWKTSTGQSGNANIVRLTDESGYMWFFNPSNVEVVFKVIDACSASAPQYWFFAGGLTNIQVTLTVTDTRTGAIKTYTNPQNTAFLPIQDVAAFANCTP